MLNLILPSLPYQRVVDPMWEEEMDVARRKGHTVCLFDADQQKLYQRPRSEQPTLYRGWMLTPPEYEALALLTPLLVSKTMYQASHQANGWYGQIQDFTPKSQLLTAREGETYVRNTLLHDRCFVKGVSKSFGASSVVASPEQYAALVGKEGIGPDDLLLFREFVVLSDKPERRFFAVRNEAFGAGRASFPDSLKPALAALQERWFYTIDVAYTKTGKPIIIEVGDGQVSDTKEWSVAELYEVAIPRLIETYLKAAPGSSPAF
ncbi:ATP-grasp domain-containing protein [Hymenobacter sp. BT175]|uniref:ATP-grasp domain-containing protein n=1 Tax=Hymenobacter translucens TaxID=2886507 RepID=UPI001D0E1D92|nr:ATP-grasp domain-containing protein [Hymenobacter translucens]MCC2548100.1 ATP-grasp domain-containing protein [Hymenobacter translucens]